MRIRTDKQVPTEEEGRIALNSNERDEEGARLLPQVVEVQLHPRPVKKRGCCVCCGLEYVITISLVVLANRRAHCLAVRCSGRPLAS